MKLLVRFGKHREEEEEVVATGRQQRRRRRTERLIDDRSFLEDDFEFGSSAPSDSQETPTPSDSSFASENVDLTSEGHSERSSSPLDALGNSGGPGKPLGHSIAG